MRPEVRDGCITITDRYGSGRDLGTRSYNPVVALIAFDERVEELRIDKSSVAAWKNRSTPSRLTPVRSMPLPSHRTRAAEHDNRPDQQIHRGVQAALRMRRWHDERQR